MRSPRRSLPIVALLLPLAMASCADDSERTAEPADFRLPLECVTESIFRAIPAETPGSDAPERALERYRVPRGTPHLASERGNYLVYVFTLDGEPTGTAGVQLLDNGWFVTAAEFCDPARSD